MKSLVHLTPLLTLLAACMVTGAAPRGGSYTPTPAQERKTQDAEEEHVYTYREVDVKAKITNKMENLPRAGRDCPREGLVRLRIILHKSGRVTEVTIIKGMGCSYDKATVEAARRFTFSPAVKDSRAVSQYQIFEYSYL